MHKELKADIKSGLTEDGFLSLFHKIQPQKTESKNTAAAGRKDL